MSYAISGQITVTTAGTEVAGPATGPGEFLIRRHPGNTGTYVYIGNDGTEHVSSTTGMPLGSGDSLVVRVRTSLAELWFDGDTNGDKVAWFRMITGNA